MNVSDSTIIRRCKEDKLKPRRAAQQIFLTAQHALSRCNFALEFQNEDEEEFWGRALFTDEKTFG